MAQNQITPLIPAAEKQHPHTDDTENPGDECDQIRGRLTEKQPTHVIEARSNHEQDQRAVNEHKQHQPLLRRILDGAA